MKLKGIVFLLGAILLVSLAVLPGLGQDEEVVCGEVLDENGNTADAAAINLKCWTWHWKSPPAWRCLTEHITEGTWPLRYCSKITIGGKRYHVLEQVGPNCWRVRRLLDYEPVPDEL